MLKGVSNINDALFTEQIKDNLIGYFDWELLNVGAFLNVPINDYNNEDKLRLVDDPNYTYGQVWEAVQPNWMWESLPSAIPISGIYVDNNFIPYASGYHVNYPYGQIIFDDPLDSTSTIKAAYSHRLYNFYDADTDWFEQIIFDPLPESGVINLLANHRVKLPAVIVEMVPRRTLVGYQLGDGVLMMYQDVLFHILSDNSSLRNKMVDIITYQKDTAFDMYDINKVADANLFPLDNYGTPISGAYSFPELVDHFKYKRCYFTEMISQEITRQLPLYRAVIRSTLQVYVP